MNIVVSDNGLYGLYNDAYQLQNDVLTVSGTIDIFVSPVADAPLIAAEDISNGLDDRLMDLGIVIGRLSSDGQYVSRFLF